MTRPMTSGVDLAELANLILGARFGEAKIFGITHDSRSVQAGDIYVALRGANHHGIKFLDEAIINGAVAVATDDDGAEVAQSKKVPTIVSSNPRKDMAALAAKIYGNPESKLVLVGITGTNGKTTTTHMLRSIFLDAGEKIGAIGTLGTYLGEENLPGARTTPESTDLYSTLSVMAQRGISHVFMEVSSHALELNRVSGLKFDIAIFTNLTQDHLDFHGSMENYFAAKALLFTPEFSKQAIICTYDDWGVKLASQTKIPVLTIGANGDWKTTTANSKADGMTTQLIEIKNSDSISISVNMLGSYNATNAACALAASQLLGLPLRSGLESLKNVRSIPGRLEKVSIDSPGTAIVDYAHTPDAVATVLTVIKDANPKRIITVIGCGGDRDSLKRPLMGKVAAQLSDIVIVTDDNPRSEDPAAIRKAVVDGTVNCPAQVFEIGDRRKAISQALKLSQLGDVVAVLGKGHEIGQEIFGQVFAFDDRLVIGEESKNA